MMKYLAGGLLVAALATPAFAAPPGAASDSAAAERDATHYVVIDTVGICSVIDAEPSAGLKLIGEKDGYAQQADAEKFLTQSAEDKAGCKDIIEPV